MIYLTVSTQEARVANVKHRYNVYISVFYIFIHKHIRYFKK